MSPHGHVARFMVEFMLRKLRTSGWQSVIKMSMITLDSLPKLNIFQLTLSKWHGNFEGAKCVSTCEGVGADGNLPGEKAEAEEAEAGACKNPCDVSAACCWIEYGNIPNSSTLLPARTESPKESDHAESSMAPCHEMRPVVPWERGSLEGYSFYEAASSLPNLVISPVLLEQHQWP